MYLFGFSTWGFLFYLSALCLRVLVYFVMHFFGLSIWGFFFFVTAIGLWVSGLGSDVFFCFLDLRLLYLSYCAWCKGVGFRLWCLFWFFDMRLLFLCYIASFKGVGFRFGGIFCFFYLRLFFLCYCDWFKSVGFRFWCFFGGGFRPEASFSMLLRLA